MQDILNVHKNPKSFRIHCGIVAMLSCLKYSFIQLKLLNVITLGQTESDIINK
jgi:hypothetical protein